MGKSSFDWLKEYTELREDNALYNWKLMKLYNESARWTDGDLARMHVSGEQSRPAQIDREIARIKQELKFNESMCDGLTKLIDKLTDTDSQILKLKYIDKMSLEDIAKELGYSFSHIKKRHAELHKTLDYIDTLVEMDLAIQIE